MPGNGLVNSVRSAEQGLNDALAALAADVGECAAELNWRLVRTPPAGDRVTQLRCALRLERMHEELVRFVDSMFPPGES
jgi:hypothetical protein